MGGKLEGSGRGEVEKSKLFCSLTPRLSLLRRREPGNEDRFVLMYTLVQFTLRSEMVRFVPSKLLSCILS